MLQIANPSIGSSSSNLGQRAFIQAMGRAIIETDAPRIRYHARAFRKGRLLWEDVAHNLVTTVGKNSILDVYLGASTQITSWFVGLVDNSGFSAYNAADTMASHSGWTESTAYDESTRVAATWGSAASSGTKTTSAVSAFTMSATTVLDGCFMNSVSTKSGTTGTLYSAGAFTGGDKSLADNDVLQITLSASQT